MVCYYKINSNMVTVRVFRTVFLKIIKKKFLRRVIPNLVKILPYFLWNRKPVSMSKSYVADKSPQKKSKPNPITIWVAPWELSYLCGDGIIKGTADNSVVSNSNVKSKVTWSLIGHDLISKTLYFQRSIHFTKVLL